MCTMKWKKIEPQQQDWERQIDVIAYYGSHTIASIVYCGKDIGWQSVIDGKMGFLMAETEKDAKVEMVDVLDSHFEGEINYYKELRESLSELN